MSSSSSPVSAALVEDHATQTDADGSDPLAQQAQIKEIAVSNVPPVNSNKNTATYNTTQMQTNTVASTFYNINSCH